MSRWQSPSRRCSRRCPARSSAPRRSSRRSRRDPSCLPRTGSPGTGRRVSWCLRSAGLQGRPRCRGRSGCERSSARSRPSGSPPWTCRSSPFGAARAPSDRPEHPRYRRQYASRYGQRSAGLSGTPHRPLPHCRPWHRRRRWDRLSPRPNLPRRPRRRCRHRHRRSHRPACSRCTCHCGRARSDPWKGSRSTLRWTRGRRWANLREW